MIVDDMADDVLLLEHVLTKARVTHPIIVFADARLAQDALRAAVYGNEQLPLMVFTDLKMPAVDGIEFTKWIRADPVLRKLFVVMLSTSTRERDLAAARHAGVDEYFEKFPAASVVAALVDRVASVR